MALIKNEVAVLFSGGIDSLLVAVLLQQAFEKIHLLTFDKGYLEFGLKNNFPNVERLMTRYGPDRIHHEIIDIKNLFKRIGAKSLRRERKKYNLETRWCVRCRLAMSTAGMIYALEHHLDGYADGSNREQIPSSANLTGTAENFPGIVGCHRTFADEYAVRFLTPTYEFGSREERRRLLGRFGFEIDFLSQDHSKTLPGLMNKGAARRSQPVCVSGWLIHWKRNVLGKPVVQNEELTKNYVAGKQAGVIREIIRDHFDAKGLNIDRLVEARRAEMGGWKHAALMRERNSNPKDHCGSNQAQRF